MVLTAQRGFTFTRLACLFFGSEFALMAFAEPRTLAHLLSDNSSTIPVLDKPGAVAEDGDTGPFCYHSSSSFSSTRDASS